MPTPKTTKLCKTPADAAALLRDGGLVAFPTETVYGLGADATNSHSVARIFESKQRPSFDPLIVHVPDTADVHQVVDEFPELAAQLAAAFWPGPLTLVLPRQPQISDLVTAGLPGVGVRVPQHPVAREVLRLAGCPVAAPSANPFSGISPTTAQHVLDGLAGRIDGVLDGGPCSVGVESTVLTLMTAPTLLRPGGVPREAIERVIGPIDVAHAQPEREDSAQPAPGMLSRHYAPRTPLRVVDRLAEATPAAGQRTGLLTHNCTAEQVPADPPFSQVRILSEDEDLTQCAARLFAAMRSLDAADLDAIVAVRFPQRGLGVALNDRLQRAASR